MGKGETRMLMSGVERCCGQTCGKQQWPAGCSCAGVWRLEPRHVALPVLLPAQAELAGPEACQVQQVRCSPLPNQEWSGPASMRNLGGQHSGAAAAVDCRRCCRGCCTWRGRCLSARRVGRVQPWNRVRDSDSGLEAARQLRTCAVHVNARSLVLLTVSSTSRIAIPLVCPTKQSSL